MAKKIGVLVGSLRKESYNRKMANALISLRPQYLNLEIVEIRNLQPYNQDWDDEGKTPSEWIEFRNQIRKYDGVLFVSPEYNRSVSGVLKNAIDVGSRPFGKSAWEGKPGGVITVSPGAIGGFGANQNLRQSMVFLNVPCMQQPEAYIGHAADLFDAEGKLKDESVRNFMVEFLKSYDKWVDTILCRK
jgi:chromate reductase, NAD(P)H dehydrogenase (quinone)